MRRIKIILAALAMTLSLSGCHLIDNGEGGQINPDTDSITITFKSNEKDYIRALDNVGTEVIEGNEYVSSYSSYKVYAGIDGIRFSNTAENGSLTISLKNSYKIGSIVINAKKYDEYSASLSVNDVSNNILSTTLDEYTFDIYNTINSVSLSANGRLYVKSISIHTENFSPIDPTSISLNKTELTLKAGSSEKLTVTYNPSDANQNKAITWNSSNEAVATVKDGTVTVKSDAAAGASTTITATLTNLPNIKATCVVTVSTINPTSIALNKTVLSLKPGKSETLKVTYSPSNANINKEITWSSSNEQVATVDNGVVSVKEGVSAGENTIITATLTNLPNIQATCNLTVKDGSQVDDAYTIFMYICGSDLESDNSLATEDIKEILSVNNQPDDVNIIIETGGAKKWNSKYGISNNKIGRWEVRDGKLNSIEQLENADMGKQSTFESFITWGLENYPAEKTAIVLWNHGGALDGCCYDQNYEKNSKASPLTDLEVYNAIKNARNANDIAEKFEWIGYDCCLMQVQDIAEMNSEFFNYMVGAQESEAGEGWEYTSWLDNVYAGDDTSIVLKAICDGFISSYEKTYRGYANDQTLSYLNLSYMDDYKEAFEDLAGKLKNIGKSTIGSLLLNNVKSYGDEYCDKEGYQDYISSGFSSTMFEQIKEGNQTYYLFHGYYFYGSFDVTDMLNKMKKNSTYSAYTNEISNVLNILDNLIGYNKVGADAGESHGLSLIANVSGRYSQMDYKSSYTNFSVWNSLVA